MVAPNPSSVTNIKVPQSEFLDPLTKRPAREWLFWLQNPSVVSIEFSIPLAISSGGTGTNALPANGQLLIGNAGKYSVANLTAGTGATITNGPGSITVGFNGVTSILAGTGISVNHPTGDVTISNTGVLSFDGSTTGLTPAVATTGNVTLGGTLNISNGGTGAATLSNAQDNLGISDNSVLIWLDM